MSIADQISRLNSAKAAIKQSIKNKGVSVSDDAKLDEYSKFIDDITIGAGGGGSNEYTHPEFYDMLTEGGTIGKGLFSYSPLSTLDLTGYDFGSMNDLSYLFYYSNMSTIIGLNKLDFSNASNISYLFAGNVNISSVDMSNMNFNKASNASQLFNGCRNLSSVNLSNCITSNLTNATYMFANCKAITSINISGCDTRKVTSINNMFQGCVALETLDLGSLDFIKVTSSTNTFQTCTALVNFTSPININTPLDFSTCTLLSHDSLMSIINNLSSVASTKKLTLGSTNLAKLTDDEKAIATNKNWTLA